MLNWVAQRGIRKRSAQTPLEHADQVRQTQRANGERVIEDIAQAYTSWRYGGHNPNLNQLRKQFLNLKASRTKKR